jgi:hypothetical protein
MKYPEDLASLFASECRMPVLVRPPKPVPPPTVPAAAGEAAPDAPDDEEVEADIEVWKADLRELSKRKTTLRGNLSAIHAVIWGQCSEAMKAKLRPAPTKTTASGSFAPSIRSPCSLTPSITAT